MRYGYSESWNKAAYARPEKAILSCTESSMSYRKNLIGKRGYVTWILER